MKTPVAKLRPYHRVAAAALGAAFAACAVDPSNSNGETQEQNPDLGTQAAALGTPGFLPISPCLNESDYVSRAVVRFWDGHYTPRCLRLASGGTVVFQGDLSLHPLEPRPGGSPSSPIEFTNWAGQVEFEFTEHGVYPYRDAAHPEETGVIWSTYW